MQVCFLHVLTDFFMHDLIIEEPPLLCNCFFMILLEHYSVWKHTHNSKNKSCFHICCVTGPLLKWDQILLCWGHVINVKPDFQPHLHSVRMLWHINPPKRGVVWNQTPTFFLLHNFAPALYFVMSAPHIVNTHFWENGEALDKTLSHLIKSSTIDCTFLSMWLSLKFEQTRKVAFCFFQPEVAKSCTDDNSVWHSKRNWRTVRDTSGPPIPWYFQLTPHTHSHTHKHTWRYKHTHKPWAVSSSFTVKIPHSMLFMLWLISIIYVGQMHTGCWKHALMSYWGCDRNSFHHLSTCI